MPELPDLTVADVRNWTVDRYFERGEGYYHEGRIQRPRREGRTLKALCRGSQPQPYRVQITLDPEDIAGGDCSCPIGDGGRCKHAVALLLTWVRRPDAFEAVSPLAERLHSQSRDELVAIIQRLLDREPSLESVVELALQRPDSDRAIDLQAYAEQAFEVGGLDPYDYGYGREVAEALDPLLERGDEHLSARNWEGALTLFRTVAETVCDRFDAVNDEEGDLISVVYTCAEGLGEVLSDLDDPALRTEAVDALLDIYLWHAESGGYGVGDAAASALREHTTPEEKRSAATTLREHLPPPPAEDSAGTVSFGRPPGESYWDHDRWTRRELGALLLDLERDRLDTEEYLALCRRTGHWAACTDRLLELDRVEEAADAAAHLPDHALTDVLDRLVERGAGDTAQSIAEARLDADGFGSPLRQWLYAYALSTDNYEKTLEVARQLFRYGPSTATYDQVREAADALGRWDTVRAELLDTLRHDHRPHLLVEIHLHEDDPDAALEIVEPFADPETRTWAFGVSVLASVADAVGDTHPEAAIALYEESARRLIDQRGRSNYAEAASILQRAEARYEQMGEHEEWRDFLDSLYEEELRRLPAAQDEFEKAGLL